MNGAARKYEKPEVMVYPICTEKSVSASNWLDEAIPVKKGDRFYWTGKTSATTGAFTINVSDSAGFVYSNGATNHAEHNTLSRICDYIIRNDGTLNIRSYTNQATTFSCMAFTITRGGVKRTPLISITGGGQHDGQGQNVRRVSSTGEREFDGRNRQVNIYHASFFQELDSRWNQQVLHNPHTQPERHDWLEERKQHGCDEQRGWNVHGVRAGMVRLADHNRSVTRKAVKAA